MNTTPYANNVMTENSLEMLLASESDTEDFANHFAPLLPAGAVVWLEGDLGAGKTALVRAMLRSLGYQGAVKSPTYALVEVYVISSIYWYHFDFYRFNEPEEFEDAGLGEYFRSDSVCLVEWPVKAGCYVPPADIEVRIAYDPKQGESRTLRLVANSEGGRKCLNELQASFKSAAT